MFEKRLGEGKELGENETEKQCRYRNFPLISARRAELEATLFKLMKGTSLELS